MVRLLGMFMESGYQPRLRFGKGRHHSNRVTACQRSCSHRAGPL